MHILCTICSDLVNPAESLYVTKCGHLFHHQCLAQWIERSKSCPQCRNKVTDRCMFRMYPTVSNESSGEDAASLQSRLDDAMLQLRTQRVGHKLTEDRLAAATELANKKEELLRAAEKRLASRESAVAALREQLEYVKVQNRETERLRTENEALKKNMQTLNGLQRVLNATAGEVEDTLRGYSDQRTLATFAAALKRALCDSEAKKRSCREQQHSAEQRLAAQRARSDSLQAQLGALCDSEAKKRSCREQQHSAEQRLAAQRARSDSLQAQLGQVQENLTNMERKYEALKHKRKAGGDADQRDAKQPRSDASADYSATASAPAPASATSTPRQQHADSFNDAIVCEKDVSDVSFGSAVNRLVASGSPYLSLKRSGLALAALQQRRPLPSNLKPSELLLLRNASTSIFHRPAALAPAAAPAPAPAPAPPARDRFNTAFAEPDGLGGRARADPAPAPRPRLSAKHRLRRLHAAGTRDIAHMFAGLRDRD